MIGAIIGDICGSTYEFNPVFDKKYDLITPRSEFTDDTVLTFAVGKTLLDKNNDFSTNIRDFSKRYPNKGYGGMFQKWINSKTTLPYNSFGNGSAMRVSFVGFLAKTLEEALYNAKLSSECTHNHPEGIKGAEAIAMAIFLAKKGNSKEVIKQKIEEYTEYDLSRKYLDIKRNYSFNEICQTTVPEAIICFLESSSYEDCIKKAIELNGDADTLACIAGGIAEAYYKQIPAELIDFAISVLPEEFKYLLEVLYKEEEVSIDSLYIFK